MGQAAPAHQALHLSVTTRQGNHLLGDPKPGHNKKIQIVFITCLEILNLCNMPQPTICVVV